MANETNFTRDKIEIGIEINSIDHTSTNNLKRAENRLIAPQKRASDTALKLKCRIVREKSNCLVLPSPSPLLPLRCFDFDSFEFFD